MVKNLLLILSAGLSLQTSITCMDKKEKEQKSISEFDKQILGINQVLQSAGLIPDLCRLIGEYDGLRVYHQLDKNNDGHGGAVNALEYISDIKCLASASWDEKIKLLDLDKDSDKYLKCILICDSANGGHIGAVNALAYISDLRWLASASNDGIKLWDLDKNNDKYLKCILTCVGDTCAPYILTYISDLKYLASGGRDGIKLWDLADKKSKTFGNCITTFNNTNGGHTAAVLAMTYIQNIKCLASASHDATIKLWNLDKDSKTYRSCIATFDGANDGHIAAVCVLAYIADIKCLASAGDDYAIKLWDLDKYSKTYCNCIATFDKRNGGHLSYVRALAYCADSKILASGSRDNTIKLWDLDIKNKSLSNIAIFGSSNGGALVLIYISDIKCLVSGGYDETIKLWINMKDVLGNFNIN